MDGELDIHRRSDDVIVIRLVDSLSRWAFLEMEISPEQFALALTNLSNRPCSFTLRGVDVVGKRIENKLVTVAFDPYADRAAYGDADGRKAIGKKAMSSHEVDGWMAHYDDLFNPQNLRQRDGQRGVEVRMHRFVEVGPDA